MVVKNEEWKEHWEKYLETQQTVPWKEQTSENGPIKINLGEIDFYIPPLLGIDAESMNSIRKHNAKIGIF